MKLQLLCAILNNNKLIEKEDLVLKIYIFHLVVNKVKLRTNQHVYTDCDKFSSQ